MGTGDILLGGGGGGNPAMDKHLIPGEINNTPRHASCQGNRDKLRAFGPLARVRLYLFCYISRLKITLNDSMNDSVIHF